MTSLDAVQSVVRVLESIQVPYLLAGSFSSNLYGIPRSTKDADFVLELRSGDIERLMDQLGPGFVRDPQMSFETVTGTHRYIVRVLDLPFKIELFVLSDEQHDQSRFARRVRSMIGDQPVMVPTAEDVIITKLRWSQGGKRAKDVDDVRNVLSVQKGNFDWNYIHHWCDQHGTRALLDQIRASIPPI